MPTGVYERTEEHRRINSEAQTGKSLSEETKKRISKNNARHWLGRKLSDETKRKISESQTGKNHSDEIKVKIGDSCKKHGYYQHPLYFRWAAAKYRCHNENCKTYKHYGGRGITMCEEWLNDPQAFIEWGLANGYEKHLQIDRRDNDGPYSPENCRFVTRKVNNNNKRK